MIATRAAARTAAHGVLRACALLAACCGAAAFAQQSIPELSARVVDLTGTLTSTEREALEQKLASFEARKGSQIAVLMVSTTEPEAIDAYSFRVAEAWRIGRAGIDDGILLVIAKDDRRMKLEVGYGLEGAVPDALASRIIRERIAPRFLEEEYAAGLKDGIDALIGLIDGEPLPAPEDSEPGRDADGFGMLPLVFLFAMFVGPLLRRTLGSLFGSAAAGVGAGVIAWLLSGALTVAVLAALMVLFLTLFGVIGRPGRWISGGRGGGARGGFGGGGGFRGGGGRFGGGGASGGW